MASSGMQFQPTYGVVRHEPDHAARQRRGGPGNRSGVQQRHSVAQRMQRIPAGRDARRGFAGPDGLAVALGQRGGRAHPDEEVARPDPAVLGRLERRSPVVRLRACSRPPPGCRRRPSADSHRDDRRRSRARARKVSRSGSTTPFGRGRARSRHAHSLAQRPRHPVTSLPMLSPCAPRTDTVGPVVSRHCWRNRVRPQRTGRPARACRAGPAAAACRRLRAAAPASPSSGSRPTSRRPPGDYSAPPPPPPPRRATAPRRWRACPGRREPAVQRG